MYRDEIERDEDKKENPIVAENTSPHSLFLIPLRLCIPED